MSFVQGRRLLASLGRRIRPRQPKPTEQPERPPIRLRPGDPYGRPRPRPFVMEMIKGMKLLTADEKLKFGYIFSELLGLPKPPEIKSKDKKFAVKLVKYDPDKRSKVLKEVAWIKSTVVVIKHLAELGLQPSLQCVQDVPYSLIKDDVTKEEANEIIAKIQAAGGVAVMEPME
ncbi:Ribosomal protein L7/L12 C-terminal [Arabidopsis thaliana x Arabidopsis arenosa]|uniref:Ribosomal protein L7/L12 C-terminal n=1 Tax=Arabidopsis thaliana x Arabidopsis arenosa TaxID=1240361 RepID=A0A8T2AQH5_9BRAS|nr:Ribosomal protein L7/L12 C-terminal [Arabidopsis thaliana x Arabidopsis arenosa]